MSEFVKRWAKGKSQFCEQPALFRKEKGEFYLHPYYIQWLSREEEGSVSNTIVLYPNCHEKMYVINSKTAVGKLKEKVKQNIVSN